MSAPALFLAMTNAMPQRPLWTAPLGLRESAVFTVLLLLTGFALQLAAGPFSCYLLGFPANLAVLCALLAAGLLAGYRTDCALCAWISGSAFATALLAGMLVLTIAMGFILQTPEADKSPALILRLGLNGVTTAWPFVLLFACLLLVLPAACARRIRLQGRGSLRFCLWHAGVFLALGGAALGQADRQSYVMHVYEGKTESRVYALNGKSLELPVAITLHDFDMEEHAPRLVLIDKKEGTPLPAGRPEHFQIAPHAPTGRLGEWRISVDTYLPRAVWAGNGEFKPMEKPGASPAVLVTAVHEQTGETRRGWISSGNMGQFQHALELTDSIAMAVTPATPAQFTSDVTVAVKGATPVRAAIRVNEPLRIGSWIIYQYGYDFQLGRYSDFSSFEIVSDPWLPAVYAGFALLALACLAQICQKRRTAGVQNGQEGGLR
jgi:hypothetical protein